MRIKVLFKTTALSAIIGGCLMCGPAWADDTEDHLTHYMSTVNANLPPNLDTAAIAALWHSDSLHSEPLSWPAVPDLNGPKDIESFFGNFDKWFADWTHTEEFRLVDGSQAFWRGRAHGIHLESGKAIDVPFAFYIEFDDEGLVLKKEVFHNPAMQRAQIE